MKTFSLKTSTKSLPPTDIILKECVKHIFQKEEKLVPERWCKMQERIGILKINSKLALFVTNSNNNNNNNGKWLMCRFKNKGLI